MKKKNWLWFLLFVTIVVLTIFTIVEQLDSFDRGKFIDDLIASNKIWLIIAIISMLGNIFFEALALKKIIKVICPEYKGRARYILYSASDIYFSAITPFSTGGQPVVAYHMLRDNISVAGVTTSLVLDYIACTFTTLLEFIIGFCIFPSIILEYSTLSIILIIIGGVGLISVSIGLLILLINSKLFKRLALFFLNIGNKLFHFKNYDERIEKIEKTVEDYKNCAIIMKNNKGMVIKVLLCTFAQKLTKTFATVFAFFAILGSYQNGINVWFAQVASDIGSSLVPLPGGVGATEYVLIDGFSRLSFIDNPANLGLMCVTVSFYSSIVVSGLIVLLSNIFKRTKKVIEE